MTHTVTVRALMGQEVNYNVASPKEIIESCEAVASISPGSMESGALSQLRSLAANGLYLFIVSPGTIVSVDDVPRDEIPQKYVLDKADKYSGDYMVIKPSLISSDFKIEVVYG